MSLYSARLRQHLRSLRLRHSLLTFLEYLVYLVSVLFAFYILIILVAVPHVEALVGLADPIEECYENTLFQKIGYARDVCQWNATLVLAIESIIYVLSLFWIFGFFVVRPLRPSHPLHPSVAKFFFILLLAMASLMLFLYVIVPLYYYLAYPP